MGFAREPAWVRFIDWMNPYIVEAWNPFERDDDRLNLRSEWEFTEEIQDLLRCITPHPFDLFDTRGIGNGVTNGVTNGITNGTVNGIANGTANGIANGAVHGIPNGTVHGVANGTTNGITNGTMPGVMSSVPNGFTNGATNVAPPGSLFAYQMAQDFLHGTQGHGLTNGTLSAITNGTANGVTNGAINGPFASEAIPLTGHGTDSEPSMNDVENGAITAIPPYGTPPPFFVAVNIQSFVPYKMTARYLAAQPPATP